MSFYFLTEGSKLSVWLLEPMGAFDVRSFKAGARTPDEPLEKPLWGQHFSSYHRSLLRSQPSCPGGGGEDAWICRPVSGDQTDGLSLEGHSRGQQAPRTPYCESSATLNAKMLKACLRLELQGSPMPSASAGKTPLRVSASDSRGAETFVCSQPPCLTGAGSAITPGMTAVGRKETMRSPPGPDSTMASTVTAFNNSPGRFSSGVCLGLQWAPPHACCFMGTLSLPPKTPHSGERPTLSSGRGRFRVTMSARSRFLQQTVSNSNVPLRGKLSGYPVQPSPALLGSRLSLTPVEFRSCGERKRLQCSILG